MDIKNNILNIINQNNFSNTLKAYYLAIVEKYFSKTLFQCIHCSKIFKTKTGLDHHNLVIHNTKCLNCEKEFVSKQALNMHLFTKKHDI